MKEAFEDCDVMTQAAMIGYHHIRDHENHDRDMSFMKIIANSRVF